MDEINSSGINQSTDPLLPSPKYRTSLAVGYFYKFIVGLNSNAVSNEIKSVVENIIDARTISRGEQKFPKKEEKFPLTMPTAKLNAIPQTTGETKYAADLRGEMNQLYAAFIKSTVGNATIENIDSSEALKMPGVVQIFLAKDIPG